MAELAELAEHYVVYGHVACDVVGLRFYVAVAGAGDQVLLQREPQHFADTNAIRVNNLVGSQVGFIEKDVARYLAPLLDESKIAAEASIVGPGTQWRLPCRIALSGPDDPAQKALVARALRRIVFSEVCRPEVTPAADDESSSGLEPLIRRRPPPPPPPPA